MGINVKTVLIFPDKERRDLEGETRESTRKKTIPSVLPQ